RDARGRRSAVVEDPITLERIASEPGRSHVRPPGRNGGPHWEGEEPKPMMHGREKSDPAIVAMKPSHEAGMPVQEAVERRARATGQADPPTPLRTKGRDSADQGLGRIRAAARQRKKERFTNLLHHVSVGQLREAFFALKRDAAPGVDGLTWRDYEADLEPRLEA